MSIPIAGVANRRRSGERNVTGTAARVETGRPHLELSHGSIEALAGIKRRIQEERLRVIMAANSAVVQLYWDIGHMVLDRQKREGWGAKVIDRLSADLREAYPDMKGFRRETSCSCAISLTPTRMRRK